jgi:hypothetical protein
LNLHQLHNATDAAALGGAQVVKFDQTGARERALALALANYAEQLPVSVAENAGNDPTGDVVLGRWIQQNLEFFPTLDAPNAVKVVAHREGVRDGVNPAPATALVFGPVFGTSTADIKRESIAWCFDSSGAGLICLSTTASPGLYVSGTGNLDVDGGGIQVNSTAVGVHDDAGSYLQGNSEVDCGQLNVSGHVDPAPPIPGETPSADWQKIFTGDDGYHPFSVNEGADYVADPLKANMTADPLVDHTYGDRLLLAERINDGTIPLRTETADGQAITGPIGTTCTLAPGYYPDGIRLTTTGETITLDPTAGGYSGEPVYVFGGANASVSDTGLYVNGGNLIGHGVTCYVTQNFSTGQYGVTRLMGNGTIDLRSPGDWENEQSGTFDLLNVEGRNGVTIWQDPTNPNYVHLNGGGDLLIHGTLYFPDPVACRLEGNLGEAGNQILCGNAEILGKAVINVNYDGRNQGVPSRRSYLVK